MFGPRLVFTLAISTSALAAGCFLDSGAFPSEGNGGSGATSETTGPGGSGGATTSTTTGGGSAGGSGGSGGSVTSTSTGTTSMPECTQPQDCPGANECTTVDCVENKCTKAFIAAGTLVSDADDTDCRMMACDGAGNITDQPDDSDTPPDDLAECHDRKCSGGAPVNENVNEGGDCAAQLTDVCQQKATCQDGDCKIVNWPDGNYFVNQCGHITCTNGVGSNFYLDQNGCGSDMNGSNCITPGCQQDAFCGPVPEENGHQCVKNGGGSGTCNGVDTTCH